MSSPRSVLWIQISEFAKGRVVDVELLDVSGSGEFAIKDAHSVLIGSRTAS